MSFKSCTTLKIEKNTVRFAHVPCDCFSLYMFVLTFAMKLKSAKCKSNWNILILYNQWKMMSDLIVFIKKDMVSNSNMSHEKMSDFVSFLLLGFTLVNTKKIDFEDD